MRQPSIWCDAASANCHKLVDCEAPILIGHCLPVWRACLPDATIDTNMGAPGLASETWESTSLNHIQRRALSGTTTPFPLPSRPERFNLDDSSYSRRVVVPVVPRKRQPEHESRLEEKLNPIAGLGGNARAEEILTLSPDRRGEQKCRGDHRPVLCISRVNPLPSLVFQPFVKALVDGLYDPTNAL
jgi:hypothetical protein